MGRVITDLRGTSDAHNGNYLPGQPAGVDGSYDTHLLVWTPAEIDEDDELTVALTAGWFDQAPPIIVFFSDTTSKVSQITGYDITTVTWQATEDFQAWQIRQVTSQTDPVTAGVLLVSGGAGVANTNQTATVTGESLTGGDGDKTVKIFAQDYAGNWST